MRLHHRADRHRRRDRSRGQSLVEFALVVPIMLFLTVIALDFGRVYLGWVNLQSMTRIAANLAANNPTAWTTNDPEVLAKYQNQIRNDAAATNCQLPKVGGVPTALPPVFSGTDFGDTATVSLSCTFEVITPGISNILGKTVTVSASSTFPVGTGMTASGGGAPNGTAPSAAFTGNDVEAPSSLTGTAPFTVVFRDTSGGNPTSWSWDFADGTTSGSQDPLGHTFSTPGTYIVTMTAYNAYGSSVQTMGITVTSPSAVDFTISPATSGTTPFAVTFTDASTPGGTAYDWDFGSGEGTASGTTASHTYNTVGTYTVTLTVTYPTETKSVTKTITVATNLCTVPSFNGVKRNNAQGVWTGAGFSGTVTDGSGAPNGNYTINTQSITATSSVPCSSSIQVTRQ